MSPVSTSQRVNCYCGMQNLLFVQEFHTNSPRPESIDNASIKEIYRLGMNTPALKRGQDYVCKSPATWNLLCKLYHGSGPAVKLSVTSKGAIVRPLKVYLQPDQDFKADSSILYMHAEVRFFLVSSCRSLL